MNGIDRTAMLVDGHRILPACSRTRRRRAGTFTSRAQEHAYVRYLAAGIEVYEYPHHFTHLKVAVFDDRWSIHGSANLNFRSLDDDNDFELVVLVDDEPFAKRVLEQTRDVDLAVARRIEFDHVYGAHWKAILRRVRNPWTMLLSWRRLF